MEKISFRILFIYFLLTTAPWLWFDGIPGMSFLGQYYNFLDNWVVNWFNQSFFHIVETLVPMGGSGDTSFGWAQLFTYLTLAILGGVIWAILDKKQKYDATLNLCLSNVVRHYVAIFAFFYGIIKLFAMQMSFPNLSQLATPLGDFLPMRLSWMFIGYSTPYQVFSGVMEVIVGILLFNRKTITPGALLGFGVFSNVVMLNLCYDIPVKMFSIQLLVCCLFLIAKDGKRVLNFFLLNRPVEPNTSFDILLTKRWHRIARIVWKLLFVYLFVVLPLTQTWSRHQERNAQQDIKPIKSGVYEVISFVKNNDTIPVLASDSLIWKDVIFDKAGRGSINTTDTLFFQRYRRGYFSYQPDTLKNTLLFKKSATDTVPICVLKYQLPNNRTIRLRGKIGRDSISVELRRSKRHFQLAEKQFHWLSEENR